MTTHPVISNVRDPLDRLVTLDEERWNHIKAGHPELSRFLREIMETVRDPDKHEIEARPGQDWFYKKGVGLSRWLKVVVAFEGDVGRIKTAFARRSRP